MYIQLYNTLNNNNKPSSSNQRASNLTTFLSETQLKRNNKVVIVAPAVQCQHQKAIIMHKIMHNIAPEYLNEVFNLIRDSTANHFRDCTLQKL